MLTRLELMELNGFEVCFCFVLFKNICELMNKLYLPMYIDNQRTSG